MTLKIMQLGLLLRNWLGKSIEPLICVGGIFLVIVFIVGW